MDRLRNAVNRFIRLGEAGLNENEASRVRAVRFAAVLRNTPWMMAANIANAIVVLTAFRASSVFPFVAIWASFVSLLAVLTAVPWLRNRNAPQRLRASLRGTKNAVIYATILSGLWATLTALFYPLADPSQKLVLVAITVGMAGGGGFALATIPPAAIVFGFFMGIGSSIALSLEPNIIGINLIALFLVYFAIIIRSSLALCASLTERVKAQLATSEQRDVIGLLLNDFEENASDWLWGVDRHLRFERASPRFYELVGKTRQAIIGYSLWEVLPLATDPGQSTTPPDGQRTLEHAMATGDAFRDIELFVELSGQPRVWSLSAKPVIDERGDFAGYRGVARDVTAARESRRKIEHMARHDALTGTANRILLNDEMKQALQRLRRHGDHFSILLLDLDRFKQVNDTHGHGAGDALLKGVADRLRTAIGEMDTLARLGGDEFAIIQTTSQGPRQSAELADKIIAALSEPFVIGGGSARIGVSIGIACAEIDGMDADALMRHADLALYRAKTDGRNRYRFFDSSLDAAARRRNSIEAELRSAVADGGLSLNYQPLVDAATGEVVCFEALLRWEHPALGAISPTEFIPIAEEAGIITDIGAWVIHDACKTASLWPAPIRVAVNLSPRQFCSPSLFMAVKVALEETGLPPQRLELEVTESLLLDTPKAVDVTLEALRNLGVRIALDDFGTGYSSLSYLRKYRFDKLKIDQSFISDIEQSAQSRAIVEAIIRLGHDLGISLAAEGVETRGQLDWLRQLGCGEIQGYLVGYPQPASQLGPFFAKIAPTTPVRLSATG